MRVGAAVGNEEHHLVRVFEASDEFISNHLRSNRERSTHHPRMHARPFPACDLRLGCPDRPSRSPPPSAGVRPQLTPTLRHVARRTTSRGGAVRYGTPRSSPHPHTLTHTYPHKHTRTHAHRTPHTARTAPRTDTDTRSAVRKCVHDGRLTSGPATYADSDAITQLSEPTRTPPHTSTSTHQHTPAHTSTHTHAHTSTHTSTGTRATAQHPRHVAPVQHSTRTCSTAQHTSTAHERAAQHSTRAQHTSVQHSTRAQHTERGFRQPSPPLVREAVLPRSKMWTLPHYPELPTKPLGLSLWKAGEHATLPPPSPVAR